MNKHTETFGLKAMFLSCVCAGATACCFNGEISREEAPFDTHGNDKHALAAYHWTRMADGECRSCNNTFFVCQPCPSLTPVSGIMKSPILVMANSISL